MKEVVNTLIGFIKYLINTDIKDMCFVEYLAIFAICICLLAIVVVPLVYLLFTHVYLGIAYLGFFFDLLIILDLIISESNGKNYILGIVCIFAVSIITIGFIVQHIKK